MISAGVEGRLPYMTYPEPWRGPPNKPPEFLRPAPKPLPTSNRYNGVTATPPNGTRLAIQRAPTKYASPPAAAPVNLVKEELSDDLPYAPYQRFYHAPPHLSPFHPSPYPGLYQSPYAPIIRPNFVPPPPLSPIETYSPTTPNSTGTFLSPSTTYSPPASAKTSIITDRRLPPSFKVPSGKEGSLKHRILTRPEDAVPRSPLDLPHLAAEPHRKRLTAATSPPQSPAKPLNNNNTVAPGTFSKGSLIQLATGELKKVEDMRTEDFVLSAERSPELRLADSTVVKIEENPITGTATITLSYNQRRTQVEVESSLEHPYFVYGQGWASCNADRTLQCFGLKVHRLQVGDILISLTPREPTTSKPSRSSTIITTATTTAMTVRPISTGNHHLVSIPSNLSIPHSMANHPRITQDNGHALSQPGPSSLREQTAEEISARKRRWSAPEQICDEDEQAARRVRMD